MWCIGAKTICQKSWIILFYCISLLQTIIGQPCDDSASIDLTQGQIISDGIITKNGISFKKDFVYTKNVSGILKTFGCICKVRPCFRKCCPLGSVMVGGANCVLHPEEDLIATEGLNTSYVDSFKKTLDVSAADVHLVFGFPCNKSNMYWEDEKDWYLQEDGTLYLSANKEIPPWIVKDIDNYCIDTFIIDDEKGGHYKKLDAFACFATQQDDRSHYIVSSSCMLTSCLFIILTVAVYGWIPELRNLHGRVLMAYLLCLFVGFLFMATMQILLYIDDITETCCMVFTFIIYFALESAFFWLNVMCFDIWWTFSGNRGIPLQKMSTRTRFMAYAMYAFGIPTLLTILFAALEFSGLPAHPFLPMLKIQGCFLYGQSRLIYLYGPIVILIIANMIFFILTAVKIGQIKKQTSVLKSKESSTHDPRSKDKKRLVLYLKLFIVMGINWIMEVISAIYPKLKAIWHYTDAYNVLIGVTIFIIFVCKRKMLRLIKKRIKEIFLRSQSDIGEGTRRRTLNESNYNRTSIETIRASTGTDLSVVCGENIRMSQI